MARQAWIFSPCAPGVFQGVDRAENMPRAGARQKQVVGDALPGHVLDGLERRLSFRSQSGGADCERNEKSALRIGSRITPNPGSVSAAGAMLAHLTAHYMANGVAIIWMCSMCSTSAFILAGGEPIAPTSRAPLSPKGGRRRDIACLEVEFQNVVCARYGIASSSSRCRPLSSQTVRFINIPRRPVRHAAAYLRRQQHRRLAADSMPVGSSSPRPGAVCRDADIDGFLLRKIAQTAIGSSKKRTVFFVHTRLRREQTRWV